MENFLNIGNTSVKNINKLHNDVFIKMENENPTETVK